MPACWPDRPTVRSAQGSDTGRSVRARCPPAGAPEGPKTVGTCIATDQEGIDDFLNITSSPRRLFIVDSIRRRVFSSEHRQHPHANFFVGTENCSLDCLFI